MKNKIIDRKIHIGTSGWHYNHWKGAFYPEKMNPSNFLDFYVKYFNTVEINNSFYRLPQKMTFENWKAAAPDNFIFSVKASRYITHIKKLKNPAQSTGKFLERAKTLGNKLGPILFQLAPYWRINPERLKNSLRLLPKKYRYTFEFRNETWFTKEIKSLLEEYHAAFCIYDFDRRQSPIWTTANFVYIRLHGPNGKYQGSYSDSKLREWGSKIKKWAEGGKEVFCYFDNDEKGYAPRNAAKLNEILT